MEGSPAGVEIHGLMHGILCCLHKSCDLQPFLDCRHVLVEHLARFDSLCAAGAAFISAGSCSISSKATSSRSSGASRIAIMTLARLDIGLPLLFF